MRRRPSWSVLFDLDDTLIHTQFRYNNAALACVGVIQRELGMHAPHPKSVIDYFVAVDVANAERYGFKRSRFVASWHQTYSNFAERAGMSTRGHATEELDAIVAAITRPPFLVKKDALETVRSVREVAGRVAILTMGDRDVQEDKVSHMPSEIQRALDEVIVVPRKTVATFEDAIDGRRPERCVMVGNSLRSDIEPAISAGAWAIHVPCETWSYDDSVPQESDRMFTVSTLRQVPRVIRAIMGGS